MKNIISLKELTLFLIPILAIAFVANSLSPRGISLFGQWNTKAGVISANEKDKVVHQDIEIRDLDEVNELFDKGVLFADARIVEQYNEGHILGAAFLPIGDIDSHIDTFTANHPLSTPIITYCSGRECDDSHELAQYLIEKGFVNVRVFIDGFPLWKEAEFPVEEL